MKNIFGIIAALLISVVLFSCGKIQHYSEIPEISYKNFSYDDSVLTFSIIDGDADVGLNPEDTTGAFNKDSAYYYNLFFKLYEKKNGEFSPVELSFPLNYRMPYYVTNSRKVYKAEVKIDFSVLNPFPFDTFKYEFFIYDRALHQSNIELTPELSFPE